MPANIKLESEPVYERDAEKVDEKVYQELIGYLIYISLHSRPDITCAVSMLSQFSNNPREQHLNAAIHVFKYLGFCDANWAQDVNDRKSQSGFCFILANGVVSWESKKQKVVATSTAEAEYIALTESAKEALYLSYILEELGFRTTEPIIIHTDSQSAQQMAKFGAHHSRTKHIHYKHHFIKDTIERGLVELKYLPSESMVAKAETLLLL
ncbi:uncharacterized protein LOC142232340 [Haematobia irritans]|uniref:uncharacterized protein LOC142232340 n=1 Tax=Haematobia irritans TaxID=7368 RepID=UPI003F50422C